MYKIFLSRRYLLARRTNWIGIVGIFVGVGAMILILSIMTGFLGETRDTVRGSLSDLVIEPSFLGARVPEDPAPMLAVVRADPRVAAACPQLSWFGLIALEGQDADISRMILSDPQHNKLSGVHLIGIDLADEYATTELREALAREPLQVRDENGELRERRSGYSPVHDVSDPFAPPPGYPRPGTRANPRVLVGEQLALNWGLSRGSEFQVYTVAPSSTGGKITPNNLTYCVAGTFRSRENEMDLGTIYFERDELSKLLGRELQFTQVLVKLKDYEKDGVQTRDDLQHALAQKKLLRGGLAREVHTWEDFKRTLLAAIENERVLMAIMLSLVVLVAGFTIFAILSMMVTEKRRDIGILCALGATPGGIQGLFLLIGFWDALVGATLGAAAGTYLAIEIDSIEQWLSRVLGVQIFDRTAYLFDHLPAVVDPRAVAAIVLFAFVCTLAFAFIPAWRAGRMHPLDALRHE